MSISQTGSHSDRQEVKVVINVRQEVIMSDRKSFWQTGGIGSNSVRQDVILSDRKSLNQTGSIGSNSVRQDVIMSDIESLCNL